MKFIDIDGKFTYRNVVAVKMNASGIFTIFPNLAGNILFVQATGEAEKATFQITDASGRKLIAGKITMNGNTSFSILINSLPKGTYNLQVHTKAKNETTINFSRRF